MQGNIPGLRAIRREEHQKRDPYQNIAGSLPTTQGEEPTSAPHVKKIYSIGDYGKNDPPAQGKLVYNDKKRTIGASNLNNPLFQKGMDEDHAVTTADEATKAPKKKIRIRDLPEAEQIRWKNIHKGK
jgi:hypothetical protein